MLQIGQILLRYLTMGLFVLCLPQSASAANIAVAVDQSLQRQINLAAPGDELHLSPGVHFGPVIIEKPLSLIGGAGVEVTSPDQGTVITISADDVTVQGLIVTGSGSSHETLDSGIKVTKRVRNARVIDNQLTDNLYGIDIHGGIDALVRGNQIVGRRDHRMNARGNGIYLWNAPGTIVENNVVQFGRDGIFVNTSKKNRFVNNRFSELRFAVHYMYTHTSELIGNVSQNNHAGYALMFSKNLEISNNISRQDRDHGFMLNYVNGTTLANNQVLQGGKKCLFMYNASKNEIVGNSFTRCPIGIHFTAGSERNVVSGNAFVGNRTQVKYVGSKWHEWSQDGQGNYWSDHTAFDLNQDGRADMVYRPNDLVDNILWSKPEARLLLGSPAVQLLRWSLSSFPALLPGGVVDSHPLMSLAAMDEETNND